MATMNRLFGLVLLAAVQISPALADKLPSASLELIQDRFTSEYRLLATIDADPDRDVRIKGIFLFDPAANVDVTRTKDGKELPNLAGGFHHGPYMRDLVVPRGVSITVAIPLPKNEALLPPNAQPGDYSLKLRHFPGESLTIRILADGSLTPRASSPLVEQQQAERDRRITPPEAE
jgi:hypothetical protein